MTFKTRLTTAIATGAVLLNALAPVALAQEVEVTNNAAGSVNTVNNTSTNATTAEQTNTAVVTNVVTSNSNTGNNTASFNSGGDTTVATGASTSLVSVENGVNKNVQSLDCDCITGGNTDVKVADNAPLSVNTVNVTDTNVTTLGQTNNAAITNVVTANSNSGGNTASFNHGGNVTIATGPSTSAVAVSNAANANVLSLGGGSAVAGDGTSVVVANNGSLSVNTVNLTQLGVLSVEQANNAFVTNVVTANANTGDNTASFNSGGDTTIHTGNAATHVVVDNLLNFNAANIDCDCVLGGFGLLKIGNNAALSLNRINATDTSVALFGQANLAALTNVVSDNSNSGGNTASFNLGPSDSDPLVHTGGASSYAGVSSSANANLLGSVDVDFNVHALWAVLWGWVV